MCGFLLEYNTKVQIQGKETLDALLMKSRLRGPDHTRSILVAPNCWFGFNRLAIQDLSKAGSQPMSSSDGRYMLVFNGEIYNHIEIREKLTFDRFKGHSDSETIVEAVSEWGFQKTIECLDGMFAIACYAHEEDTLYCARDIAGIKPLFYGWDGNIFVAASQFNQVIAHPSFRDKPVDPEVLRLYLEQHFMPAPFGLYKDTGQLEPGEIVEISRSGLRRYSYWEFPEYFEPEIYDEKEAMEWLNHALSQSVQAQMVSDVPLGAFLSGGIDSPLITYYASRVVSGLQTFTIGSDSTIHDETLDAQTYASLLGVAQTFQTLNASVVRSHFEAVMDCLKEPMADFSIIPTFLVSRLARKKATVALSGDGGDELFFGYERFWSVAKNISFQHYPWLIRAGLYKWDKWKHANKHLNSVLLMPSQASAHRALHTRFPRQWLLKLFPDLSRTGTPDAYHTYEYANTKDPVVLIQRMRKAEFYGMMQKTLRKVDLGSMGNSLEVRVPFLGKKMIEAALRVDPFLSFGPNQKKQILKNLLKKYLPDAPIDNRKRGFSVPLGNWMKDPDFLNPVFEERKKILIHQFGIEASALQSLLHEHQAGPTDLKWPLFTLMALCHD